MVFNLHSPSEAPRERFQSALGTFQLEIPISLIGVGSFVKSPLQFCWTPSIRTVPLWVFQGSHPGELPLSPCSHFRMLYWVLASQRNGHGAGENIVISPSACPWAIRSPQLSVSFFLCKMRSRFSANAEDSRSLNKPSLSDRHCVAAGQGSEKGSSGFSEAWGLLMGFIDPSRPARGYLEDRVTTRCCRLSDPEWSPTQKTLAEIPCSLLASYVLKKSTNYNVTREESQRDKVLKKDREAQTENATHLHSHTPFCQGCWSHLVRKKLLLRNLALLGLHIKFQHRCSLATKRLTSLDRHGNNSPSLVLAPTCTNVVLPSSAPGQSPPNCVESRPKGNQIFPHRVEPDVLLLSAPYPVLYRVSQLCVSTQSTPNPKSTGEVPPRVVRNVKGICWAFWGPQPAMGIDSWINLTHSCGTPWEMTWLPHQPLACLWIST